MNTQPTAADREAAHKVMGVCSHLLSGISSAACDRLVRAIADVVAAARAEGQAEQLRPKFEWRGNDLLVGGEKRGAVLPFEGRWAFYIGDELGECSLVTQSEARELVEFVVARRIQSWFQPVGG